MFQVKFLEATGLGLKGKMANDFNAPIVQFTELYNDLDATDDYVKIKHFKAKVANNLGMAYALRSEYILSDASLGEQRFRMARENVAVALCYFKFSVAGIEGFGNYFENQSFGDVIMSAKEN